MSTSTNLSIFKVLSILLQYPTQTWLTELPEIESYSTETDLQSYQTLQPLFERLQDDEITLQTEYVATFDRTPTHSLHLFEHLHGEDRLRGQAMVDLLETYRTKGFEPTANELPDYLPLFLEFLASIPKEEALPLLGDAIHVIHYIGENLAKNNSPYAAIFEVIDRYSPVKAEPLKVAPIRNMEEAMEQFGPNAEGIEPLLSHSFNLGNHAQGCGSTSLSACHKCQ